jgi:hypothetical protein
MIELVFCQTRLNLRTLKRIKPEGKTPLERPWSGWENNIRIGLTKIGWELLDWLWLGYSGGSCEHGNEPSGSIKSEEFLDQLSNY